MCCEERIYPPCFWYGDWIEIPGLPGFEISPRRLVRASFHDDCGDFKAILTCEDGLLQIGNHFHSTTDLMMLAYIGPRPLGFTVQKRDGSSEDLSNLFYGPQSEDENDSGTT